MLLEGAAFVLNYDEMIEYTLQAATDSNGTIIIEDGVPQFFFQPLNLGKTRIAGFELSAVGEVKVWGSSRSHSGRIHVQLRRRFDQRHGPGQCGRVLGQFFQSNDSTARDSLVAAGSLLKYRNKGRSRWMWSGTWGLGRQAWP